MSSILKPGTKKTYALLVLYYHQACICIQPMDFCESLLPWAVNKFANYKTEHANPTHTSVHNFHVEDNQIHTNQAALVLRVASNNCTCWLLRNHSPSVASNNLHMLFNGKRLLAHRTVTILVVPFACGSLCCISFCSANVGQILL